MALYPRRLEAVPHSSEDELGQRFPGPGSHVTFLELSRQRVGVGGIADGQSGQRLHALRNAEHFTGLVRQNAGSSQNP